MSLSGARLETSIENETYNQLNAIFSPTIPAGASPAQIAGIQAYWRKLAQAVATGDAAQTVAEIVANAVVPVVVANVTGVQTGTSSSGPGTGTGTIT